jgi:hypothetical protein
VTTFHATVRFDLDCDGMSEVTSRFEGPFGFPTTASATWSTAASSERDRFPVSRHLGPTRPR